MRYNSELTLIKFHDTPKTCFCQVTGELHDSLYSRETYIDCSYIFLNVFEKKFFKRVIYAAIHTSLDSVLDADYGDIIFIVIYFELKEFFNVEVSQNLNIYFEYILLKTFLH